MTQICFVDRRTATPADTLVAFGLASLLFRLIPEGEDSGLTITDQGDSYRISLAKALREAWVKEVEFFTLIEALDTTKRTPDLPTALKIDYVSHQERNRAYFEARKQGLDEKDLAEQGLTPPHPNWATWAVINQMSGVDTYNGLAELWYAHRDCFPGLIDIILELYRSRPNPVEIVEVAWKELAKANGIDAQQAMSKLQVINPGMGKGNNRSKADGLSIGGLKGFWIPEILKFAGLFQGAIPRTVKGSKDRKTYVLRPRSLAWTTHRTVFRSFQGALFSQTAAKMDILAALRYCRVFLEQWRAGQSAGRIGWGRGQPGDHVAAIEVIDYKHLGSAHATMNLSSLVLPLWLPEVETLDQADRFLDLLAEHDGVVRNLREEVGDEYELLRTYRDFLSARDLRAFYRFARGYSKHVMRRLVDGGYPPRQFTVPNLEVLIMAHDQKLVPILENEGFRRVAEAIRRSTVIPQYQKAQGRDLLYEIRYGLGDKLLRRAQNADEFIQELGQFMHDYNRENAQKSETRKQQFRSNLTVEDVEAVVGLVDAYGSATVASLLVAFGYARDPSVGKGQKGDLEEDEMEALEPEEG